MGAAPARLPLDLGEAVALRAERLAAGLEARPGGPATWRPCRLLFRNFWLFHREEFRFVHGRLFLRGANTSGKSTVLAAALPLLLDGSQVRHRLDTFGGSGRTLQYFLLGPDSADPGDPDAFYHDQRTAYLALEFERPPEAGEPEPGAPAHRTIGIGLHCSRHADGRPVTFWGFVLRDGRRLGRDLDVVGPDGAGLRRQELEALLGAGGTVVSGVQQYRDLVDESLFGFGDREAYANLLQLLLELRAPKLNRDMGPAVVAELLAESLPPIDADLFEQMRSILQRIDEYVDSCALLRRHHAAAARLDDAVALLQARRAEAAAARYAEALRDLRAARECLEAAEAERGEAEAALERARERAAAVAGRRAEIAGELSALRESEVLQAEGALGAARARLEAAAAELGAVEGRLRERQRRTQEAGRALELARDQRRQRAEGLRQDAAALVAAAAAAEWPAAREAAELAAEALAPLWAAPGAAPEAGGAGALQLPWLEAAAAERRERLREVRRRLGERDAAASALAQAEALFQAVHERTREARQAQVEAERDRAGAAEAAAQAVVDWSAGLQALRVPPAAVQDAASALRLEADPEARPGRLLAPLRAAIAAARAAGEEARRGLAAARDAAAAELAAREAELAAEEARSEAVPPRSAAASAARAALAAAGIPARPFYEACELDPALAPEEAARIEAAAEQAGLLDALVLPPGEMPRAEAALREAGLGDTWVLDPGAAAAALGSAAGFSREGTWRQGWLGGRAVAEEPAAGARYFGVENRRRRHLERLGQLRARRDEQAAVLAAAEAALAAAEEEARRAEREAAALDDLAPLGALLQATALEAAARAAAERAVAAEADAARAVQEARARREAAQAALEAAQAGAPESRGRDREGLERLLEALEALLARARGVAAAAEALAAAAERVEQREAALRQAAADREEAEADLGRARERHAEAAAAVAAFERLLASPAGQADRERYRALEREEGELGREALALERRIGGLEGRLSAAAQAVAEAAAARDRAARAEEEARADLEARLSTYPSLELRLAAFRSGPSGPEDVARDLLGRRAADADLRRRIAEDERAAERALDQAEFESREVLADYGPEFNPEAGLVRFRAAGTATWPADLRQDLEGRLLTQEQLLRDSERELYEEFILGQMRDSIQRRIHDAQGWTERINEDLREAPLSSGEVLELRFAPLPESGASGSSIARHVELLLQDPGLLRPEERDVLTGAFREDVERVRRQEREEASDLGFAAALERALDYRRWFRFQIVSRAPHQRAVEIDDRRFSTRSGAEKSLALLLPLSAAAAARYDAARVDAPRLIGFDEAFAGVDPQNVGEALRFLCNYGFCWIMASERLWGVGAALPAAATYELVRRGNVAGALPFFWDGAEGRLRDVTAEVVAETAGGETP